MIEETRHHPCRRPEQPYDAYGVKIVYHDDGWFLEYASYAIEQNVRAGEADYVGEEMTSVGLRIEFCPYCGQKL